MKINKNKNILNVFFGLSSIALVMFVFSSTSSASALSLYRQLQIGMTGSDVRELQTYLAGNSAIYPEGITSGFFGNLTRAAVRRFQALAGISQVGRVGPQTMAALNSGNFVNSNGNTIAPFIQNVNIGSVYGGSTITWNTDELSKGKVFYSSSPLQTYETYTDVTVTNSQVSNVDSNFTNTHGMTLSGLQSGTTYYYMIYVTDQDGNVSVSVPWNTFRTN